MEIHPKDGQVCIFKAEGSLFKISECQRLAKIANTHSKSEIEDFKSLATLTQAITNRYKKVPFFEIHAIGLSQNEQYLLDTLKKKMTNIEQIRFINTKEVD